MDADEFMEALAVPITNGGTNETRMAEPAPKKRKAVVYPPAGNDEPLYMELRKDSECILYLSLIHI